MIRDILNAVQTAVANVQPPGNVGPTPASSNVGTGRVTFDSASKTLGTFNGLLQVVSPGPVGTATAKLSLDGGNNFDNPFPIPAQYFVPLPPATSSVLSPGPSGLVLDFSGSFSAGDSYSFSALPQINFLWGAEELSGQDSLFPRIVFVPTEDDFSGTEDYAQGRDVRTQPRSLTTDVAHFETHCWGIDYDRTELLRDTLINGVWFAVQATRKFLRGHWEHDKQLVKAGRLYVLNWTVMKPVLVLSSDTTPVPPPFTAAFTPEVDTQ